MGVENGCGDEKRWSPTFAPRFAGAQLSSFPRRVRWSRLVKRLLCGVVSTAPSAMLRSIIPALLVVTASVFAAGAPSRSSNLFCIADDISWPHMSTYGCTVVNTPGFDRVEREGMFFQNCFTANPKCSQLRASLLTGRQSFQLGGRIGSGNRKRPWLPGEPIRAELQHGGGIRIEYPGALYHMMASGKNGGAPLMRPRGDSAARSTLASAVTRPSVSSVRTSSSADSGS